MKLKPIQVKNLEFSSFHQLRTWTPEFRSDLAQKESNRKAMKRNWINQKANPALQTKTGNK